MFELYANKTQLTVRKREPVTSGSVNVYRARFEFSDDWDGLTRKAVFIGSGAQIPVLLDESGGCYIPWEAVTKHGGKLFAGVYGTHEETALPTIKASLGTILEGVTVDGESSKPPTPEEWRQELAGKGDRLDYTDAGDLGLYSSDKLLSAVTLKGGGGGSFGVGHGLKVVDGSLTVDVVDNFNGDNTLPMTAAGVYSTVGNIEVLLKAIRGV